MLPDEPLINDAWEEYGRSDVVLWDVLRIPSQARIQLVFESVNSDWRQGVRLTTDSGLLVNGMRGKSVVLWQDTAPSVVDCECSTKDGRLHIYNIWDSGRGYGSESQRHSSGMLVEEILGGRRYRCNDIGFEGAAFDKLVFSVVQVQ